jgi:hypothetical protein
MAQKMLFLKLLVHAFNPGNEGALFALMPEGEGEKLAKEEVLPRDPTFLLPTRCAWLDAIHYSWLSDPLHKLPEATWPLVIAALPEAQSRGLVKHEKLTPPEVPKAFSQSVKDFLTTSLYKVWPYKNTLSVDLLPQTPLLALTKCSKRELVELVDLLAMYDLAAEVCHIVDKKLLIDILRNLSANQQNYLKICLRQKSRLEVAPLDVRKIYKDKLKFLHTLHKRGIRRLATALSGQSTDLVTHIAHIFDIGRGKLLEAYYQKEEVPTATPVMQMQTLQIVQLIQSKSKEAP